MQNLWEFYAKNPSFRLSIRNFNDFYGKSAEFSSVLCKNFFLFDLYRTVLIQFANFYLWKTFPRPIPLADFDSIRRFAKFSANISPNSSDLLDFPKKRCYNRIHHYIISIAYGQRRHSHEASRKANDHRTDRLYRT